MNPCYFIGSLKKNNGSSFSVFPQAGYNKMNLSELTNGIYASFYGKEIVAIYEGEFSRLTINPSAKKEKITQEDIIEQLEKCGHLSGAETSKGLSVKKNGFFKAALCCFHPDYAAINNEKNALELTLEMHHGLVPNGFIVKTKNFVNIPAPKIGLLKYI